MKFSFVILTWNRYKFLEKCLDNLVKSIGECVDCEVIIMDNGSDDDTEKILEGYKQNKIFKIIKLKKNYGIKAYKKLFNYAKGELIVIVDDDVLSFPDRLDKIFTEYMTTFPNYGFLALNVIQDEFTNGSRHSDEFFVEETINGKTILEGPTGGWCSCFRKKHYDKLRFRLFFSRLSMKYGEDGFLVKNLREKLGLQAGIIKEFACYHASGPFYAVKYGHIEREIEKYSKDGLKDFVEVYKAEASKGDTSLGGN